jgi:amino acid transporter
VRSRMGQQVPKRSYTWHVMQERPKITGARNPMEGRLYDHDVKCLDYYLAQRLLLVTVSWAELQDVSLWVTWMDQGNWIHRKAQESAFSIIWWPQGLPQKWFSSSSHDRHWMTPTNALNLSCIMPALNELSSNVVTRFNLQLLLAVRRCATIIQDLQQL